MFVFGPDSFAYIIPVPVKNIQLLHVELACCRRASTAAQHITAQSAVPKQRSTHVPIRARQRKQSRQSWREPVCRRACAAHCLCSRNQRRNRNLIGPTKKKKKHKFLVHDTRRICLYVFPIPKCGTIQHSLFLLFRKCPYDTCMRRPGCFLGAWSSWHLQVVSLHL